MSALAFADNRLVVGRWDGTVTLVDVSGPRARVTWTGAVPALPEPPACAVSQDDRKVRAIAYEPDTRLLAVGANNCVIALWTLPRESENPGAPQLLNGHDEQGASARVRPGQHQAAVDRG